MYKVIKRMNCYDPAQHTGNQYYYVTFSLDCFWMLDAILQYATTAHFPSVFKEDNIEIDSVMSVLPQRLEGNQLFRYVCENEIICSF